MELDVKREGNRLTSDSVSVYKVEHLVGNWIISMSVEANPGPSNDWKSCNNLLLEEVGMKVLNESSREKGWGGFINVLHKCIWNVTSLGVSKDLFLKALRTYDEKK